MSDDYELETQAIRAGTHRSQFNEHSEAMYLTSSFVFENAAQAAARFSGQEPGNIYARFTNPTVTAFQERLAAMEGAVYTPAEVMVPLVVPPVTDHVTVLFTAPATLAVKA